MITSRKDVYGIEPAFRAYLSRYGRESAIPIVYNELLHFTGSVPYEGPDGKETLWLTVMYPPGVMQGLRETLLRIYCQLKIGGDMSMIDNLIVERIDYGEFGNSNPFRIKITNKFNDNSDYYYVKNADANRLFGLELEHILSPSRINYLVRENTLIEEHIAGLPGQIFNTEYINRTYINQVRIAKEFVKFNERCYIRLLGDMRAVNYVVDITPDFEEIQYRVRPIDFDQQSYESHIRIYMPYRFGCNKPINRLVANSLNRKSIQQYQREERHQMARRGRSEIRRLSSLIMVLRRQRLAPDEHLATLRRELSMVHRDKSYLSASSMAELTAHHIRRMLANEPKPRRMLSKFLETEE